MRGYFGHKEVRQVQAATALGNFLTIDRYFQKLEALGIIQEITSEARGRVYRADKILQILKG